MGICRRPELILVWFLKGVLKSLTHDVSSVRSIRPPWRNPPRRSRLSLRFHLSVCLKCSGAQLVCHTRGDSPYFILKIVSIIKSFWSLRLCSLAQCNFPHLSQITVPSSPKLEVKRRVRKGLYREKHSHYLGVLNLKGKKTVSRRSKS